MTRREKPTVYPTMIDGDEKSEARRIWCQAPSFLDGTPVIIEVDGRQRRGVIVRDHASSSLAGVRVRLTEA